MGDGFCVGVQHDAADDAPHQHIAAGRLDGAGQRARQPLRTALHVAAAALQVATLRKREIDPPQRGRVVMEIGQVGGDRAFDSFVVAEHVVELLRERQCPVAGIRKQFQQSFARIFRRVLALRDRRRGSDDPLHLTEQLVDALAGLWKTLGESLPRRLEVVGHQERLGQRTAARLIEVAGGNPGHLVDHAGARQHVMLGVARMLRVAGFVQRSLDKEFAGFVARRSTPDRVAALDHEHLAALTRQDRAGRQAAEAGADHYDIIGRHTR